MINKIVIIDEENCIACGKCVEICPRKILYIDMQNNTCKVTDENKCDKFRGCEMVCPSNAIKIL
jgi:NAD-dependent dihydropyrimidine dehydrogenase PreA subunit